MTEELARAVRQGQADGARGEGGAATRGEREGPRASLPGVVGRRRGGELVAPLE